MRKCQIHYLRSVKVQGYHKHKGHPSLRNDPVQIGTPSKPSSLHLEPCLKLFSISRGESRRSCTSEHEQHRGSSTRSSIRQMRPHDAMALTSFGGNVNAKIWPERLSGGQM